MPGLLAELVITPAQHSAQVGSIHFMGSVQSWWLATHVNDVDDDVCHSRGSLQCQSHSLWGCHWLGCLLSLSLHLHRTALSLLAFTSQLSYSADGWRLVSMVGDDVCHSCGSSQLLSRSSRGCHWLGCLLNLSLHL